MDVLEQVRLKNVKLDRKGDIKNWIISGFIRALKLLNRGDRWQRFGWWIKSLREKSWKFVRENNKQIENLLKGEKWPGYWGKERIRASVEYRSYLIESGE